MRMRISSLVTVLALLVICAPRALAEEAKPPVTALKAGDAAPDFEWPNPSAKEGVPSTLHLSALKDRKSVLIAFYPKAFTGGCTKQLCGYRDDFEQFKSNDTEVVAVSTDKQAESDRFRTEMKMPFAVLGDPEHKVIDAYGVPLKDAGENRYAQRAVVLVGKDGKVRYIDMDYRIGEDEKPLFDAIRAAADGSKTDTKPD